MIWVLRRIFCSAEILAEVKLDQVSFTVDTIFPDIDFDADSVLTSLTLGSWLTLLSLLTLGADFALLTLFADFALGAVFALLAFFAGWALLTCLSLLTLLSFLPGQTWLALRTRNTISAILPISWGWLLDQLIDKLYNVR
jgi:hypothetical protein